MINRLVMVRECPGSYISLCGRYGIWQDETRRRHGRWYAENLAAGVANGESAGGPFRTYAEALAFLERYSGVRREDERHHRG